MKGAGLMVAPVPIPVPAHLVAARARNHPTLENYGRKTVRRKRRTLRRVGAIMAFSFEAALGLSVVAALILATR